MLSTGCWFIQCINQRPAVEKLASGIFLVAVDGGWSSWSQWSHCTKNIGGIQMRIRRCVNPHPQWGEKPCPGPDVTVIRGCTNISHCGEGISQMLKNLFAYYSMPLTTFSVLFPVYFFWDFKQKLCFVRYITDSFHFWNSTPWWVVKTFNSMQWHGKIRLKNPCALYISQTKENVSCLRQNLIVAMGAAPGL